MKSSGLGVTPQRELSKVEKSLIWLYQVTAILKPGRKYLDTEVFKFPCTLREQKPHSRRIIDLTSINLLDELTLG